MAKQPLTLTARTGSGVHTGIENIHCATEKRMMLPIPPPTATKKYLLMNWYDIDRTQAAATARHSDGYSEA
ncbi:MAG: hypothetical protein JO011_14525 [Ktedonobacteraceae bacterium]|nr:hypothetical protein [Ktedonobacteraceae bacterium]